MFAKNVVKSFQSSKFLLSSAKVAYFPLKRCRLLFGDLRTGGTGWLVVTYVTSAFISISGSLALWWTLFGNLFAKSTSRKWEYGLVWYWLVVVVAAGRSKNLARKSVPDWKSHWGLREQSFQHILKVIFNIKKLSDAMLSFHCWGLL